MNRELADRYFSKPVVANNVIDIRTGLPLVKEIEVNGGAMRIYEAWILANSKNGLTILVHLPVINKEIWLPVSQVVYKDNKIYMQAWLAKEKGLPI